MPAWRQRLASLLLLPDPRRVTWWEEDLVNRQEVLPRPAMWGLEQSGGCQELGSRLEELRKKHDLMGERKDATQTLPEAPEQCGGGRASPTSGAGTTGVLSVSKKMMCVWWWWWGNSSCSWMAEHLHKFKQLLQKHKQFTPSIRRNQVLGLNLK